MCPVSHIAGLPPDACPAFGDHLLRNLETSAFGVAALIAQALVVAAVLAA